ncbi:hypothetical protein [Bremerella cremea]|uniref:hypothetical protein n=1 Tax=Bremerella cremea TaxID=1031537 RepID=UPI0031EB1FD1
MLLSSCPRCHDSIRIPSAATEMSVIRCPRCGEQFPLGEIINLLPPEAEIISGPGSEVKLVFPNEPSDGSEYALVDNSEATRTDFQFKESGPMASSPPMAKIDSNRPPRRPKRPEPNVAIEFLKVIVGGVVGLGLALFAVMWFMHKDPIGIVKQLPAQAYFIVPHELRTPDMKKLANQNSSEEEAADTMTPTVPTETIPLDDQPPANGDGANAPVSRNAPAGEKEDESPLATAFQQQVNASKQDKPAPKPRAVNKPAKVEPKATPKPMAEEQPKVEEKPEEETPPMMTETAKPMVDPEDEEGEPTEPTPIEAEVIEQITLASEELGEIGAEIPPHPSTETTPIDVGNVDLSPVGDGDN